MSDEAPVDADAPSVRAGWNVRVIFGSIVLGFAVALVSYVVLFGKADNSLHQSALAWAFALMGAILMGFGIGASLEPLLAAFKK